METVSKLIQYLRNYPKKIFLIDGIGALLTTFFLFAVLRNFNEYFGLSKSTLTFLSIISLSLGLYSMTCFFLLKTNWKPFLKGISFANIFYCILTIGMMFLHQTTITPLGILYFSTEIIIIGLLVYLELKVARS